MTYLPSLPEDANLGRVYAMDPPYYMPMVEFSESVMRGPSPLSPRDRELIAAYTSGLNACGFCTGAHRAAAIAFGLDEGVFQSLIDDLETAQLDERLKPILSYVRKLTLTPSRLTQGDADAVYAAGSDETALSHAINVCALFNCFNRIVDSERGAALSDLGYMGMHGPRLRKLIDERQDGETG